MFIDKSSVDLAAQHHSSSQTELDATLRAWIGAQRPDFEAMDSRTTASISAAALAALKAHPVAAPAPAELPASSEAQAISDAIDQADNDPVLRLIRLMVEMLTGQRLKSMSVRLGAAPAATAAASAPAPGAAHTSQSAPVARAGYGLEYDERVIHSESEQTLIQARGEVLTADGRAIAFRLDLAMTRSYREETSVSLRAGDGVRKDPLVINFAAATTQLESQRFSFSLDASVGAQRLPMLARGSGFLALDLNGNGAIDSGKELFGAKSGDGFADLAAYDSDHNGWIDEADAVFSRLRIWRPDAQGQGTLATLSEAKVGALALARTATPFELRDSANRSLGGVAATGVFLREDGSAGSLQQVDLTV